jgi:hypothetical protein
VLLEILQERAAASSRNRRNPHGVKRKMSRQAAKLNFGRPVARRLKKLRRP